MRLHNSFITYLLDNITSLLKRSTSEKNEVRQYAFAYFFDKLYQNKFECYDLLMNVFVARTKVQDVSWACHK